MIEWVLLVLAIIGFVYYVVLGVGLIVWLVWLAVTGQLVSPYENQHALLMYVLKQLETK